MAVTRAGRGIARGVGRPAGQPPKTDEEVRAAAANVFRRLGYRGTRMEDVAAELGLTKSSLYHYVATKEELLFSILLDPYREAIADLTTEVAGDAPPPVRLARVLRRYFANVAKYYPAISIYLAEGRRLPVPDGLRALDREYVAGLRRLIVDGVRSGALRTADPDVATAAIVGMCNQLAIRYDPHAGHDAQQIADDLVQFVLHGLQAEGG